MYVRLNRCFCSEVRAPTESISGHGPSPTYSHETEKEDRGHRVNGEESEKRVH